MMSFRKSAQAAVAILAIALWFIAGCSLGPSGGPDGEATVQGTVTLAGAVAGKAYAVYIDTDFNGGNGYVEKADGTVTGTTIPYSFSAVGAGTYFICCHVDLDGSGGSPNDGDYLGYFDGVAYYPPAAASCSVPSTGTVTFNFDAALMEPLPKATVNGTVTLPAIATGKPFAVYIDNNGNGGDGYTEMVSGIVVGSTVSYSISDVDAGTYYVYCHVDLDGSGSSPNYGDYLGYRGGTILRPRPRRTAPCPRPARSPSTSTPPSSPKRR